MRRIALLALAALIATPAMADKGKSQSTTPEATASSEQPAPAAKPEPKTCRTFENTVSRMKAERLCMTREEWKKFDETQY